MAAASLLFAPALAAPSPVKSSKSRPAPSLRGGKFTPAVADPRLAAELARRGLQVNSFRFTPASISTGKGQAVKVAIRARGATPAEAVRRAGDGSTLAVTAVTPAAYSLGASVGWKRFAISGDVDRVSGGAIPGDREAAAASVSYSLSRYTGRIEAGAARAEGTAARLAAEDKSYTLGVGGSYRIARNIDLTGGVRYKIQNDRLEPLADQRRDSQAVYIGTAFKF